MSIMSQLLYLRPIFLFRENFWLSTQINLKREVFHLYILLKSLTYLKTLTPKQIHEESFRIQKVRSSDTLEQHNIKTSGICLSVNFLGSSMKNVFKRPKVFRSRFFVYVSQKCEGVMQRMFKSVLRILLSENMLRVLSFVTSHLEKKT